VPMRQKTDRYVLYCLLNTVDYVRFVLEKLVLRVLAEAPALVTVTMTLVSFFLITVTLSRSFSNSINFTAVNLYGI
jgi:hypothetical protein